MTGGTAGDQPRGARGPRPALPAIDADFPGWHGWQSDAGRCWATRTGPKASYRADGVPMTVDADSEHGLRKVLAGYEDAA